MSEWIDVEDRMPVVDDEEFWCWVGPNEGYLTTDGSPIVATHEFYGRKVKTYRTKQGELRFNCGSLEQVTHWMPLPLPDPPAK